MNKEGTLYRGYGLLKWGILISALHINFDTKIAGFQIIPEFIGLAMVMFAVRFMNKNGGERYFKKIEKETVYLQILSVVQFVSGLILFYTINNNSLVTQALVIASFLYQVVVFTDILNVTVKLYKDNNDMQAADKLRKNRIMAIKLSMALAILWAASVAPGLRTILGYAVSTLSLLFKLWLSMLIDNVLRKELSFKSEENKDSLGNS